MLNLKVALLLSSDDRVSNPIDESYCRMLHSGFLVLWTTQLLLIMRSRLITVFPLKQIWPNMLFMCITRWVRNCWNKMYDKLTWSVLDSIIYRSFHSLTTSKTWKSEMEGNSNSKYIYIYRVIEKKSTFQIFVNNF